jgi:hypothetical protein
MVKKRKKSHLTLDHVKFDGISTPTPPNSGLQVKMNYP